MHAWILVKVRDMHNSNGPLSFLCISAVSATVLHAPHICPSLQKPVSAPVVGGRQRFYQMVIKAMWPDCTIQLIKPLTVSQLLPKTHLSCRLFTSTIVILASNKTADCDWWIEECSFKITVLVKPSLGAATN